jgi:hypothetical protein
MVGFYPAIPIGGATRLGMFVMTMVDRPDSSYGRDDSSSPSMTSGQERESVSGAPDFASTPCSVPEDERSRAATAPPG